MLRVAIYKLKTKVFLEYSHIMTITPISQIWSKSIKDQLLSKKSSKKAELSHLIISRIKLQL